MRLVRYVTLFSALLTLVPQAVRAACPAGGTADLCGLGQATLDKYGDACACMAGMCCGQLNICGRYEACQCHYNVLGGSNRLQGPDTLHTAIYHPLWSASLSSIFTGFRSDDVAQAEAACGVGCQPGYGACQSGALLTRCLPATAYGCNSRLSRLSSKALCASGAFIALSVGSTLDATAWLEEHLRQSSASDFARAVQVSHMPTCRKHAPQ